MKIPKKIEKRPLRWIVKWKWNHRKISQRLVNVQRNCEGIAEVFFKDIAEETPRGVTERIYKGNANEIFRWMVEGISKEISEKVPEKNVNRMLKKKKFKSIKTP